MPLTDRRAGRRRDSAAAAHNGNHRLAGGTDEQFIARLTSVYHRIKFRFFTLNMKIHLGRIPSRRPPLISYSGRVHHFRDEEQKKLRRWDGSQGKVMDRQAGSRTRNELT